jgi:hypothetical protein
VSYEPRTYDQIVRDILTTLTGGTVRETVKAPAGNAVITPAKLLNRPVRRVSSLDGVIGTPDKTSNSSRLPATTATKMPFVFAMADAGPFPTLT